MKFLKVDSLVVAALAMFALLAFATIRSSEARPADAPDADFAAFAALAPIDTHIHLYQDDPRFGAIMQRLNLRALNICVIDDRDPFYKGLEPQRATRSRCER